MANTRETNTGMQMNRIGLRHERDDLAETSPDVHSRNLVKRKKISSIRRVIVQRDAARLEVANVVVRRPRVGRLPR
jgi:hypothetical protein